MASLTALSCGLASVSYSTAPAASRLGRGATRGQMALTRRRRSGRRVGKISAELLSAEPGPASAAVEKGRTIVGGGEHSLEICRVVNGMWQVSSPAWGSVAPEKAIHSMVAHFEAGLTTFDLADIYGPAEEIFGGMIDYIRRKKGEHIAENVQGLTKYVPSPNRMTRAVVEGAIDRSRKRMQVNTLDMVQFHWWDYNNDGYLDALKHLTDLREAGKIRTVSLTNFDTKRLQITLENGIPIASNQVQHSLVDMRPQQRMAELCSLTGVQLITYGTVLGGLLSEKFLDSAEPNSLMGPKLTTPSQGKYKRMIDAWGGWALFQKLLRVCKKVGDKYGVSISTIGLSYILSKQCVAASMVGVRFGIRDHFVSSKEALELQLDQEDLDEINAVISQGRDLMNIIGDCGDEYR